MLHARRLIDEKNNMMNYSLSKRSFYSGMETNIESYPGPSEVSGPITIGGEAEQKAIFRVETQRS